MKQSSVLIAVAALAVGSATGCRSTSPDEGPEDDRTEAGSTQAKVTGEASYLVRMAVPPEAVLTVRLEDVSIADASAAVLGEQVIEMQGRQVPIPFEIPYDTSRIDEHHRYIVRATIHWDERMMFTSTEAHPGPDARQPRHGPGADAAGPAAPNAFHEPARRHLLEARGAERRARRRAAEWP